MIFISNWFQGVQDKEYHSDTVKTLNKKQLQ